MSLERTQAVVDKWLAYDYSVLAGNATGEIIGLGEPAIGPVAIEEAANALYTVMFDAKPEISSVVIGESIGVTEYRFIGTHTGTFAGIPATGKAVNVPSVAIYDIEGDQIVAVRVYLPISLVLEQLGA